MTTIVTCYTPKGVRFEKRVNPWHSLKTHCKHGHPFKGLNLRLYTAPNGAKWRLCVKCLKAKDVRKIARLREKPIDRYTQDNS